MAQLFNKRSVSIAVGLLAICIFLCGCRCRGFYSPVYSQRDIQALLERNEDQLTAFADSWFSTHRDDEMRYEDCHGEKLTLSRYARDGAGIPPPAPVTPEGKEIERLKQFAKEMKLEDVSVFRANESESWYVQLSFQGGSKWPYGLIYVPAGEPMNMLNSADGGPEPGFSKVVPIHGRWLYFESR